MKGDLMIILDNSMYSINQDHGKKRLASQVEATQRIISGRLVDNTESTIGIMTLGRKRSTKIVSPTTDRNVLYTYMHSIKEDRVLSVSEAIPIAQMALRFRTHKSQGILVFLGSPLSKDDLEALAFSIREALAHNISVRAVLFGEALAHHAELSASVEESSEFTCVAVRGKDDFEGMVRTALRESPEDEADPELALAIKMSLESKTPGSAEDAEDVVLQEALRKSLDEK
jgi:von Willebrand factor type A domain